MVRRENCFKTSRLFLTLFIFLILFFGGQSVLAGSIVGWEKQVVGVDLSGGFSAIAASHHHSLGLKEDRSIVAWGDNYHGQCNIPAPNNDFIAIAAGEYHSLGLKQDSSIVAWGHGWAGKCDVPVPNTDFIAIAAGADHSLGLKQDGSIVAWGTNWAGQYDIPSPNSGFVAGAEVTVENGSGQAPSASVTSVDGTIIEATVTAHRKAKPGVSWDVRVTNPDGSSNVLVGGLTVAP